MNILVINKFLYPKGGDAVAALSTGKLLEDRGHHVYYWGMASDQDGAFAFKETWMPQVDLNAREDLFGQLKTGMNLLYSLEAKRRIRLLLNKMKEKPDVVHLHNYAHQISPSIIDVFKEQGIPCVMTMHDYKPVCASYTLLSNGKLCDLCAHGRYYHCFQQACVKNSRAKSLLNTMEMYLHHSIMGIYDYIHCFISPSLFLKNKVESMGFRKKIIHLSNFVDVSDFVPSYDVQEESVVFFGRLSKEKGILTLINAAASLPNICFKIIGDGPLRPTLERSVLEKGLKNVFFLGHKRGEDLYREVKRSMCVVIPSEWHENNPRSVIEAFALGKPVFGARIGGIPELVIDDQTGMTFTSGDADDLAAKIRFAAGDKQRLKYWGRAGRSFVEENYNSQKHYAGLMSIYNEAIEHGFSKNQ